MKYTPWNNPLKILRQILMFRKTTRKLTPACKVNTYRSCYSEISSDERALWTNVLLVSFCQRILSTRIGKRRTLLGQYHENFPTAWRYVCRLQADIVNWCESVVKKKHVLRFAHIYPACDMIISIDIRQWLILIERQTASRSCTDYYRKMRMKWINFI